ncbi:alcohol dehydrogenase [Acinetobacter qingfengensis]|uniref:Alcohol dehydrogenase n=2 Tax=Acinetobacter qingfengensis TaxID=1262585 RepID=A0A1E7R7J8_9GAMM|nr:alcohol dehydrogenase [Acinetobacter qingfengensis]
MLYKRTLPEIQNTNLQQKQFDYVIVGAGSAGSVIANRLSENPAVSVCLIEAGSADNSPRIHIPSGTITLYKSHKYSWNYFSVPQKRLNNRQIHTPRGKMVGGSSSMNSMLYIRGNASDYDNWKAKGCTGWGWNDVLPFFKKSEKNLLKQSALFHGFEGELCVDQPKDPNPLSYVFIKAASHLHLKENKDFNATSSEGVGIYDVTQQEGKRLSSFKAFVQPILNRPNLTVVTDCEVDQINHQQGQVESVSVKRQGEIFDLKINKELILSAGAFVSPMLLMKSGIGPKQQLEEAGITCKVDLAGVGQNLQEHIDGLVTVRTNYTKTLGFSMAALVSILPAPFKYVMKRKGWMTTNYVEAGGFAKTPLATDRPDVQFHFVPGYRSHRGRLFEWGHGYAIHTCVLRPKSIGEVRINAKKQMEIDYNFFEKEEDMKVLIEGVKLAQNILKQKEFEVFNGKEILPGPHVKTNADYEKYVRESAATVFHPIGTCKMGTDAMSVVDPQLKVYGFRNLRVADASIMPDLISGNTNAPCIMIGERAADFITCDSWSKNNHAIE